MRKLKYLTKEEELELFKKFENGEKRKDIIEEYGISDRYYYKIIKENDIDGKLNTRVQKYKCNEDYFEVIDTEDKAYFLGFIVADGNINSKTNGISIIQKETNILYEFKKFTKFEGNISTPKSRDASTITINSKKLKDDLYNLGIYPAKTMIVKYPEIPKELEHHFMRGVFDGDGCISIHKSDKKKGGDRGQVNICSGSKEFIEQYVNRLNEYCGITKNKIRCPKGTYSVIDWGALSDIDKFYNFFYKDATIYLERKKKTFEEAITISKSKIRYRKK